MINYELVCNNSKQLIILFQSAGRIPKEVLDKLLIGEVSTSEINNYHKKYNWFDFTQNEEYDYLFIEDFYNNSYGWYMIDNSNIIIQKINQSLLELINNNGYENVIAFGSSKGGTAALLYGLINPKINRVFSVVPQINSIKYIHKHMNKYKNLILRNAPESTLKEIDNIFYNDNIINNKHSKDTNIYIYTGIKDDQFNELVKLNKDVLCKKRVTLIINNSLKKHTKLVTENYEFIKNMLYSIASSKKVEEQRLINIANRMYLLNDI